MFGNNATVSSRSSSSRSGHSYRGRSSQHLLSSRTCMNPLFRHSDQFTSSFDASNFVVTKTSPKARLEKKYRLRYADSSGDDVTTPESTNHKGRKSGNDGSGVTIISSHCSDNSTSSAEEYVNARDFLERYSLPRVIKLDEDDAEPLLLYRCFDNFTKIQAKSVHVKKGKERIDNENVVHFPEGYAGWFSLLNEKGEKHAIAYTSILHLVREQVCSFLAVQPFAAYATDRSVEENGKLAYFKTQLPGGQLYQLRAVFQHQEKPSSDNGGGRNSTRSSRISRSSRDKELSNRYAQLVSQNNQELYVPLTTKGEFYETHTSLKSRLCFPGMLDKTGPLALDKECLYKIGHLLRRVPLPVKVKLLHGALPEELPSNKDFTDSTFILEKKFREPLLVTCTLPAPWSDAKPKLGCFNLSAKLKLKKFDFGYDSENKMFKSQRLQSALIFCQKNLESWYKEAKLVPKIAIETAPSASPNLNENLNSNPNSFVRMKPRESARNSEETDEKSNCEPSQIISKQVLKNFRKPRKWYQNFKLLTSNSAGEQFEEMKDPMDGMEKRKSMDRYKDMSKLIEEKLGRKGYNPVKKSASFMFTKKLEETANPALLKCQSLDSQLYSCDEKSVQVGTCKSNKSDNLSYEFQMCILDDGENPNATSSSRQEIDIVRKNQKTGQKVVRVDIESDGKLQKTRPDLIPTLPKIVENGNSSIITQKLYSEFHVKTKVQPKKSAKFESNKGVTRILLNVEDIPYSQVKDEVATAANSVKTSENIYAEIVENCDNFRTKPESCAKSPQYYVKLGSNGDSVTQSDSDDAIYNTLR